MESGVEGVCLAEGVSWEGEGSVEVSLVLVQCIFGPRIQIR